MIELKYALDTLFLLFSGILVMWMAAGFSMLEAGLVRTKNTTDILVKNIGLYSIACLMYLLLGYQIMYGGDKGGLIPNLGFLIGGEHSNSAIQSGDASFSKYSDFFFQVVFVATAMSVVSGAVAERMKLSAFFIFAVLMTSLIYPVSGYWHWGNGFLKQLGFSDFAGSGIVHLIGATAAFTGAIIVGARRGRYSKNGKVRAIPGANMPLAAIGTLILWMGWFGFNGGSQLMVSDIENANAVSKILVNTNAAAVGGVLAALVLTKIKYKKFDFTMMLNGALAGLVAITAEPLSPSPVQATLVGSAGSLVAMISIAVMDKIKIDDPVGAISVHGIAGIFGLLVVPLSNANVDLASQLIGIGALLSWGLGASVIAWKAIDQVLGLRVSEQAEYEGLDAVDCGIEAYPEFHYRAYSNDFHPDQLKQNEYLWDGGHPQEIYRNT